MPQAFLALPPTVYTDATLAPQAPILQSMALHRALLAKQATRRLVLAIPFVEFASLDSLAAAQTV